tara:strand:+ start:2464 stop:2799 length:336 start_codon:yes stop_codon:yes gene_type:complete
MIEIPTKPTAKLNVSKIAISLNSAAEFSMQFSIIGWGLYPGPDGKDVWGNTPIVSTLLSVSGAAWTNWGKTPGETDSSYIGNLCLSQLGLERDDTVVAVEPEAPAEAPAAE